MPNHETVTSFENEIAKFYGAPYAVAVDSCTHAIELCLRYKEVKKFTITPYTYPSIPGLAKKIGIEFEWKEEDWKDYYYLGGTNIIDAAVFWKENSYIPDTFMCLSFQFKKHLNLGRGGMILTDDKEARDKLVKMAHDGRNPGISWVEQNIDIIGYHYNMIPEIAEEGLRKLPEAVKTKPKKWSITDWPDLRNMEIFK